MSQAYKRKENEEKKEERSMKGNLLTYFSIQKPIKDSSINPYTPKSVSQFFVFTLKKIPI